MSRTETVIRDIEQTLKKEGLSPHIKSALKKKLNNLRSNTIIQKTL